MISSSSKDLEINSKDFLMSFLSSISIGLTSVKRDLNLLEMYDADYSVCLNGNCKEIIEYMLSNCIEIQERV